MEQLQQGLTQIKIQDWDGEGKPSIGDRVDFSYWSGGWTNHQTGVFVAQTMQHTIIGFENDDGEIYNEKCVAGSIKFARPRTGHKLDLERATTYAEKLWNSLNAILGKENSLTFDTSLTWGELSPEQQYTLSALLVGHAGYCDKTKLTSINMSEGKEFLQKYGTKPE